MRLSVWNADLSSASHLQVIAFPRLLGYFLGQAVPLPQLEEPLVSTTAFEVQSATESSIQCDPQQFSANFNRVPFEVRHSLAGNPLFDVDRIIELAQRVEARRNPHRSFGDAYSNMGEVGPGMKAVEGHRP